MLSEAVLASFTPSQITSDRKGFSISQISTCAYANYLNYHKLDPQPPREPEEYLRMDDGHYQEAKILNHIHRAGFKTFYVGDNQITVHVGRASVPGHPDGFIKVDGRVDLLEIKAMSLRRFTRFSQGDLELGIKVQVQSYLLCEEFPYKEGVWVYAVHKDSCRPLDRFYPKDPGFILPVLDELDMIILDDYEPKKELTDRCSSCRHQVFCWGVEILDLSEPKIVTTSQAVDSWRKGKAYKAAGEELLEEVKGYFRTAIGSNRVMFAEGDDAVLKVQKILSKRTGISMERFIQVFGPGRLQDVWEERPIESLRIDQVD